MISVCCQCQRKTINLHISSLTLRTALPDESDRLLDFYRKNPDPRPESEFKQAISRGHYFLIEEAGEILAATGVFDYEQNLPVVELAETRVTKSVQGYGLQSLFFRLRVASVTILQGTDITITTAIDPKNTRSLENAKKQGFQNWSPITEALKSCSSCRNKSSDRPCCCDYFSLSKEATRRAVALLLKDTEKDTIDLTNKTNQKLTLPFTCNILRGEYRIGLEEFAAGQTW